MDGVTILQVIPQTQMKLIAIIIFIFIYMVIGAISVIIGKKRHNPAIGFIIMTVGHIVLVLTVFIGLYFSFIPTDIYDEYYQIKCNDVVTYSELIERYDIIEIKEDNTLIVKERK